MEWNQIGSQIKSLRMAQNITQSELAARLNVTKSTISAYENSVRLPSYDVLIKISLLFHVSTDYLLGINSQYALNVSGLTPQQFNTLQEITNAYLAYNKLQME